MLISGAYGELLGFGLIFAFAIWKNKIYLAAFMIGYMVYNLVIFSMPWMIGDFEKAMIYNRSYSSIISALYITCRVMNYAWVLIAFASIYEQRKYMEKMWRWKEKLGRRKIKRGAYETIFGKGVL